MGRIAGTGGLRPRAATTDRGGAGELVEPEPDLDGRVRPADEQPDWADAPGNTVLPATVTGLPKDSVANASQIVALDRRTLAERVRRIGDRQIAIIMRGIDIVLGR